jgi:uncharacterized protein (UPF0332 family)
VLTTARKLARSASKPRQADLKRAVSTAYYAVFNFLAKECSDLLVGTGNARRWPCWRHVHRALDHGFAKQACGRVVNLRFPPEIIQFATAFISLQQHRHVADYDPTSRFERAEVIGIIDNAEKAMSDYEKAPRSDRIAFAVLVLLKLRTD